MNFQNETAEHAERYLLGALVTRPGRIDEMLQEHGLRAQHFSPRFQPVAEAVFALHDEDKLIDAVTVADRSGHRVEQIQWLHADLPTIPAVREYVGVVKAESMWRTRFDDFVARGEAILERDDTAYNATDSQQREVLRDDHLWDAERMARDLEEDWAGAGATVLPLPWRMLNKATGGGLRPGDATVIAGWSSMGKSVAASNILEHNAQAGAECALYTNETTPGQFRDRLLAGLTSVPHHRIIHRPLLLNDEEKTELRAAALAIPFKIVPCFGWSTVEISRHMRRHKWDMAAMDLFNRLPDRGKVSDVDAALGRLLDATGQSGQHLLLLAQLNQASAVGSKRPMPVGRDLRESGSLYNDPPNVMFVHREQEVEGRGDDKLVTRLPDGWIYFDKLRNGNPEHKATVRFKADRMRFDERIAVTA